MPMSFGGISKQKVATVIVAADGTGDTTDIQTGINLLPAGGGVVYVKEGTYILTAGILITSNNVSLIGAGRSTRVQINSDTYNIAIGADYFQIEGLYVYGAGAGNLNNTGIDLANSSYGIVSKCWVENCGASGITVSGTSTGDIISFCSTINNTQRGIFISDGRITVMGNVINSNGDDGISITSAGECQIIGNQVVGNTRNGMNLNTQNNSIISNNLIKDNDVDDTATYDGIRLVNCDNNVITGNRCVDNDNYEISITTVASANNVVVGNICIGADHVGTINDQGTDTELAHNQT